MKHIYVRFPSLICLVCFVLGTILPVPVLAGPKQKPGPWDEPTPERWDGHGGKHDHKHKHHPAFTHVPPGGQKVRHRGGDYFFHSGRFYRHEPKGYFWVRPPLGIIAYSLPAAAITVLIGGLTYYVYDNVYYRRVPAGYQVVQVPTQTTTVVHTPPAVAMDPEDSGAQIVVTTKMLNVRSGPGINHPVINTTYMGNVLIIQGSSSDWYYVRLPDNTYGWVMKAFVTMPDNGAQG